MIRKTKQKKQSEADIQMLIVRWLTQNGFYFFSVPNELLGRLRGAAGYSRMARYKAMGLRAGVADLVVLLPNGRTAFLEVKTPTGKQSEHQKDFQNMVEFLGFKYFLVRSVDDVEKALVGIT